MALSAVVMTSSCDQSSHDELDIETAVKKWNAQNPDWTPDDIRVLVQGERLYRKNCSACHKRDGSGEFSIGAPPLHNNPLLGGSRVEAIKRVLHSRPGSTMPAFKSVLSGTEIAAIISYASNEWDNSSPVIILSEQVDRLR